jgi:phosphoglycerate dehydrogenase-like enzyme
MVAMLEWVISYRDMTDAFSRESWTRLCFARPPHGELAGKTLGIVGFGHIGKAIARRARSFEMRVLATGRTARAPEEGAEWIGGTEDLDRLLRDSDFVVLACPLNAETRGLIGAPQLAQMKPSAVLINVARGDVVVQDALFAALKDRRIGGAVLDVWYRYPTSPDAPVPPADYPFETLPNVHATAHVSGWTDGLFERRWSFIAANIGRFARGEPLQNLIRPPVAG